jgi:hypothetical protein
MHLLGKIKVKVFIHMQALMFTICHFHTVHSLYSHTHMHHIGSQEETPVVELEDPEGELHRRCPGTRSRTWSCRSA